jgi:hypothetical protein
MRFRARGARRALVASALLALAALTVVAGGSAARTPEASGTEGIIDAQWTPGSLRDAKTTVVVELAGKPVTVVEADAERSLSKAEKSAIKADLQAKQDGLKSDIQALGGQVLADYQVAYNGIKVRIDRSQLNDLKALKGVAGVHGLQRVTPDNVKGVQLIGAPTVWDGLAGLHGENIKIAVIDTGIDYTHANFGGPGTVAAFQAADAVDTLPPMAQYGWGMRVKGGTDLVGDDYNADPDSADFQPIPHPDPEPARLQRARLARRRHRSRLGRDRGGRDLQRPVQRHDDHRQQLADRSRRCPEGRHLRHPRLRLRRLDRRHRRRDRVGGRQRHGRDQHVPRLVVRNQGRPVGSRLDQRGQGRRDRRHLRRQQRPVAVHHRLAGHGRGCDRDRRDRCVAELPRRRDHDPQRPDDRGERERVPRCRRRPPTPSR